MTSFVGTNPNQVPTNSDLGRLAFVDYVGWEDTGAAIPTITATSIIAPVLKISKVSGTAIINTITPPLDITNGGQLVLIPTARFSFDTTGNIALSLTAEVSKPITLTYESISKKWYPSYSNTINNLNVNASATQNVSLSINNSLTFTGIDNLALASVTVTSITGSFSCTTPSKPFAVGMQVTVTGTNTAGAITGYINPSTYYIIACTTNTFQLSATFGGTSITTVTGATTGLTFTIASLVNFGRGGTVVYNDNSSKVSVLAQSTSTELRNIISDPTGTGSLVFGTNPTLTGTVTINGNLELNGTSAALSSLTVDDNNIEIGSIIELTGYTATLSLNTAVVTLTSGNTTGFLKGQSLTVTGIPGGAFGTNATIDSIDSSTQITVSVNHATAGAVTFKVGPSNITANGGGITLKGTSDKTITWDSTNTNWTSSENWNVATGKTYKINNVNVLTATSVLNDATQTSITVGGAATAISIGASTGILTIGNATITGTNATALNLNGASPSIATSSNGTASVFNTNALTGNLFGAATAVNIGSILGTTTINGNLIVNGTTTTINSSTLSIDDKNIELGAVVAVSGLVATLSLNTGVVTLTTGSTAGLLVGQTLSVNTGPGAFGASALILSINSAVQFTASINHNAAGSVTFTAGGTTNDTANGGGITLKGASDKTITWVKSTDRWTSNVGFEAASIQNTPIGSTTASTGKFTTVESTIATGTAPFTVASNTVVSNLNASLLNGATFAAPGAIGSTTASTGKFTTVESTIATGTAPFTVASTTNVANLNASLLNGATFAAPGAIGSTTRSTGAFTTLGANNTVSFTAGTTSTSTTTGTVQVTGGVGISENLYVGGNLMVTGSIGSGSSGDLVINGNLTVKGTTTTINSTTVTVKDKNIELGTGASASITGNIAFNSNTITNIASTVNILPGATVTLQSGGVNVTLPANTTISTVDSLTQVTLTNAFTGSGSATGATFSIGAASNDTANGGGITLKGAADKTFNWIKSTDRWTSNVGFEAASIQNTPIGSTTASTGKFTTVESTIAAGTAPFIVASNTVVANLNSSLLNGATFAAPGAIGSTTASTGAFTTLGANNTVSFTAGTTSTSTTTGTLKVTGGVGISENLNVGGRSKLALTPKYIGTFTIGANDTNWWRVATIEYSAVTATNQPIYSRFILVNPSKHLNMEIIFSNGAGGDNGHVEVRIRGHYNYYTSYPAYVRYNPTGTNKPSYVEIQMPASNLSSDFKVYELDTYADDGSYVSYPMTSTNSAVDASAGTKLKFFDTTNGILRRDGYLGAAVTRELTVPASGTSGNLLTSNGSTWTSAPPPITLPAQSTHNGHFLTTDGSNASWSSIALSSLSATGTKDATTYLAGDNTWKSIKESTYRPTVPTTPNPAVITIDFSTVTSTTIIINLPAGVTGATITFTNLSTPATTDTIFSFSVIVSHVTALSADTAIVFRHGALSVLPKWTGNIIPPSTVAATAVDIWAFFTYDAGSSLVGSLAMADVRNA